VENAVNVGKHREFYQAFLYEALKGDTHLITLRNALEQRPQYLDEIATEVFGEHADAKEWLVSLVDLAARARLSEDDQSLIPARYHSSFAPLKVHTFPCDLQEVIFGAS